MNQQRREDVIRWVLVLTVVFILLIRLFPAFRFVLGSLILISLAGLAGWFTWYLLVKRKEEKAFERTTEGQITRRLAYCREQMRRNQQELEDIENNIRELETKLDAHPAIAPQNRKETQELIKAFSSEKKLREARIAFFQTCEGKLETLLHNQQLARELADKKKKLKQLRENHFEELADLEELRSNVEMDVLYLDTIEQLSDRMRQSNTVDDAILLSRELEKMTRELEEL